MPQAQIKPSDIAAEAKKIHLPKIIKSHPQSLIGSISYPEISGLKLSAKVSCDKLRIAVIEGDAVDVALDWHDAERKNSGFGEKPSISRPAIPVVNMANEKRAGGDWESGSMAPEECLCRRSTLVHTLVTPHPLSPERSHYPIATFGGIYSPSVVVFRSGPGEDYRIWPNSKSLPVISVAPVRRPRLNETDTDYCFVSEKQGMEEKMRAVLRIAVANQHAELCIGGFGLGYGFRNPAKQVARMWRGLLFSEVEFKNAFDSIVFAMEDTSGRDTDEMTSLRIFEEEFDPSNIVKTTFR